MESLIEQRIVNELNLGYSNSAVSTISFVGFEEFFRETIHNMEFMKKLNTQGRVRHWKLFKDYHFGGLEVGYIRTSHYEKFSKVIDEYFPNLSSHVTVKTRVKDWLSNGGITDSFDEIFLARYLASLSRTEIMRLITGLKLDNPTIKLCHLNLHDRDLLIDIEEHFIDNKTTESSKAISIALAMNLEEIYFSYESFDLLRTIDTKTAVSLIKETDPFLANLLTFVVDPKSVDLEEVSYMKILAEFSVVKLGEERLQSYSKTELQESIDKLVDELVSPFNQRHQVSVEFLDFLEEIGLTLG